MPACPRPRVGSSDTKTTAPRARITRSPSRRREHAAPGAPLLPARYRDLGRIAAGGFGEIRRVYDAELDRVVAMKVLHAGVARAPRLEAARGAVSGADRAGRALGRARAGREGGVSSRAAGGGGAGGGGLLCAGGVVLDRGGRRGAGQLAGAADLGGRVRGAALSGDQRGPSWRSGSPPSSPSLGDAQRVTGTTSINSRQTSSSASATSG
jgi:hypothetical protein